MPDDLVGIAREIVDRNWTVAEWAERESDDEFQTARVVGGFDATEGAFCFSLYDDAAETEWWIQLTLPEVKSLASGRITELDGRLAE